MSDRLKINQWAEADRPRERLRAQGAEALTDAELLAILIGSGTKNETAVDLMKRILSECHNSLNLLGKLSYHELTAYKGIGAAKAITIMAACELGRRRSLDKEERREDLGSAMAISHYMQSKIGELPYEEAWLLLLNNNFRLIRAVKLSTGGLTETAIDVRLVVKEALLSNATIVALSHNHPSGNNTPSRDDDRITEAVHQACKLMRIHLLDHVIVTDAGYYSYREMGRL